MAASAAEYILNELYWTDGRRPPASAIRCRRSRVQIHNANFLGAALLCRVHTHTGDRQLLGPALSVARYSASSSTRRSWAYGEEPTQQLDRQLSHRLQPLRAARRSARAWRRPSSSRRVRRGLAFYRAPFFPGGWRAAVFPRPHVSDRHSLVAQSIITLVDAEGSRSRQRAARAGGVPLGDGPHVGRPRVLLLPRAAVRHDPDLVHAMVAGVDAPGAVHAAGRRCGAASHPSSRECRRDAMAPQPDANCTGAAYVRAGYSGAERGSSSSS